MYINYIKLAGIILSLFLPSISGIMDRSDDSLKIGGRPKRKKKKPRAIIENSNGFTFDLESINFDIDSIVYVYSDLMNEQSVEISHITENEDSTQDVYFSEIITFTDFETLYFEIETE